MFNGNGGYSLSDIAAVSGAAGGRGGFGGFGDDGWWIILLFLFGFGTVYAGIGALLPNSLIK